MTASGATSPLIRAAANDRCPPHAAMELTGRLPPPSTQVCHGRLLSNSRNQTFTRAASPAGLRHAGHPGAFSSSSEADIAVADVVDREGGNLPFIRSGLNGEVVAPPDSRTA